MIVPENISGRKLLACEVPSGAFAALEGKRPRHLFFVSWRGDMQAFFPVLADGTISQTGTTPGFMGQTMNYLALVDTFIASQIPGLKSNGNKIVWSDKK